MARQPCRCRPRPARPGRGRAASRSSCPASEAGRGLRPCRGAFLGGADRSRVRLRAGGSARPRVGSSRSRQRRERRAVAVREDDASCVRGSPDCAGSRNAPTVSHVVLVVRSGADRAPIDAVGGVGRRALRRDLDELAHRECASRASSHHRRGWLHGARRQVDDRVSGEGHGCSDAGRHHQDVSAASPPLAAPLPSRCKPSRLTRRPADFPEASVRERDGASQSSPSSWLHLGRAGRGGRVRRFDREAW